MHSRPPYNTVNPHRATSKRIHKFARWCINETLFDKYRAIQRPPEFSVFATFPFQLNYLSFGTFNYCQHMCKVFFDKQFHWFLLDVSLTTKRIRLPKRCRTCHEVGMEFVGTFGEKCIKTCLNFSLSFLNTVSFLIFMRKKKNKSKTSQFNSNNFLHNYIVRST